MSAGFITFKAKDGSTLDMPTHAVLSAGMDTGVALSVTASGASVDYKNAHVNVFEKAYSKILETPFVSKINGVKPADNGVFFVLGSMCDSVLSGPESSVSIVDLCPTCTSCAERAKLRKQIEFYKIFINAIKDAQLYNDTYVQRRAARLAELRTEITETCAEEAVGIDEYTQSPAVMGLNLLQQYVATVNMWNYVVSKNNASNVITAAPDDNAGFVVQTKRALPSCDGNAKLSCSIEVSAVAEGVSVYVPAPSVDFKPFSGGLPADWGNGDDIKITHIGATDKEIGIQFPPASKSGTYLVTAKFLPFRYVTITGPDGAPLRLRDTITDDKTDDDTENDDGVISIPGGTVESSVVLEPTAADYAEYKTYPSISPASKIMWDITITWTWTQLDTSGTPIPNMGKTYVDQYVYEANGVRDYVSGILIPSDIQKYDDLLD